MAATELSAMKHMARKYGVIGIDEGQFVSCFTILFPFSLSFLYSLFSLPVIMLVFSSSPWQFPDIVEFCEDMANDGKTVIVAALDGTFQREPFGSILNLVPLAESVVKLKAVCMLCYNDAAFTKRLGGEKEVCPFPIPLVYYTFIQCCDYKVEVIGGADKYMAVCRTCYKMPEKSLTSTSPTSETPLRGPELGKGRTLLFNDNDSP